LNFLKLVSKFFESHNYEWNNSIMSQNMYINIDWNEVLQKQEKQKTKSEFHILLIDIHRYPRYVSMRPRDVDTRESQQLNEANFQR